MLFEDEADLAAVDEAYMREQEWQGKPLCVEKELLRNFYPAEEEHQDYLVKHTDGYCHVDLKAFRYASLLKELESRFRVFLDTDLPRNPLKAEFFLPFAVNELLREDRAVVRVLQSEDRWWGVTYQEDRPQVRQALRALTDEGLYPGPLWG